MSAAEVAGADRPRLDMTTYPGPAEAPEERYLNRL